MTKNLTFAPSFYLRKLLINPMKKLFLLLFFLSNVIVGQAQNQMQKNAIESFIIDYNNNNFEKIFQSFSSKMQNAHIYTSSLSWKGEWDEWRSVIPFHTFRGKKSLSSFTAMKALARLFAACKMSPWWRSRRQNLGQSQGIIRLHCHPLRRGPRLKTQEYGIIFVTEIYQRFRLIDPGVPEHNIMWVYGIFACFMVG